MGYRRLPEERVKVGVEFMELFKTGKRGCGSGDGFSLFRTFILPNPETDQGVKTRNTKAKYGIVRHGSAAGSKYFNVTIR